MSCVAISIRSAGPRSPVPGQPPEEQLRRDPPEPDDVLRHHSNSGAEHVGELEVVGFEGKTGKVKLATFDADATQMTMMKAGTIQLAIAQEPALEGSDGVQQALNAIDGKPVTKNIATPLIAVTPGQHEQRQRQAVHLRVELPVKLGALDSEPARTPGTRHNSVIDRRKLP
jgi:hypothetical protein